MLRLCACLTAAVIGFSALSAFAFEEPKGEKGGKGKRPRPTAEEMLKRLDKNGDGKLSKDEFTAGKKDATKAEERFNKLDADKDGFVTLDELKAGHEKKKKA